MSTVSARPDELSELADAVLCADGPVRDLAGLALLRAADGRLVQRQQPPRRPNLDWADRALLANLLAVIPQERRHGLWLLVTWYTTLRWHRDIVRRRLAAGPNEPPDGLGRRGPSRSSPAGS